MAGLLNSTIETRILQAVENWNLGDSQAACAHYADDAQISSLVAGEWLQIGDAMDAICLEFRRTNCRLTLIDILDGLNHVTALLHDGKRHYTMTIEPDEDMRARRIIICRGSRRGTSDFDEHRTAA